MKRPRAYRTSQPQPKPHPKPLILHRKAPFLAAEQEVFKPR
jgi:hypothetical protein